ncbi:MAG: hydrogenase maturation nickel metallochaperone HypA [Cyanobacteria bacterium J06632_3]
MHEVDMTKALIMTVQDWLAEQPGHPPVKTVYLTVGEFTCVEPASLTFAFSVQRQGTCLEQAELVIQDVPLVAYCHPCSQEYRPDIGLRYACPTCQSPMEDIRSGRELKVDRVEFMTNESTTGKHATDKSLVEAV